MIDSVNHHDDECPPVAVSEPVREPAPAAKIIESNGQYQRIKPLLARGLPTRQIVTESGVDAIQVREYRQYYEELHGKVKCPCGHDAGHRGACRVPFSERPPRTASEKPRRKESVATSVPSTAVVRDAVPGPALKVSDVAAQLREHAEKLESQSDRMRAKAADLREAARLMERAVQA